MGYIEEEEFLDTLVVDSEGYICGRVASFEIAPDKVMMRLYKEVVEEREVVDLDKLKQELMLRLFGKIDPRLEPKLYQRIRKDLKLPPDSVIGETELVSYARLLALDIPMKVVTTKTKRPVEEPVDLDMVDCMNETPLGKCILLKTPWEAERRGLPLMDFVPYKSTAEIKGMLVIDSDAKIVGHAERILIGKPLGLRIAVETVKEVEEVDFEALYQGLLRYYKKPKKLIKRVAHDLGIRPEMVGKEQIIAWAERLNLPIPKKRETRVMREMTLDIPWTLIKKIGDVIILSRPIEELRMKGMPVAVGPTEEVERREVALPRNRISQPSQASSSG